VLRQLNGIIAGTVRMHWLKFLLFNAIGAGLWVGTWSTLFYLLGRQAEKLDAAFRKLQFVLLGVAGLAVLVGIIVKAARRKRQPVES
ncbi:MAG TPA: DedA family protein, partial [Spirochaetia bacterium]|nr:DedA family protein [Spirochaetia bacterium]